MVSGSGIVGGSVGGCQGKVLVPYIRDGGICPLLGEDSADESTPLRLSTTPLLPAGEEVERDRSNGHSCPPALAP